MFLVEEFNESVDQWTKNLLDELKDELDYYGVQHYSYSRSRTPLRQALKSRYYTRNGAINRIGIRMPRSAVFLHKGVSNYHPKENPRTAKPWFNPVVDRNIGALAQIAAQHAADFITNHIYIK